MWGATPHLIICAAGATYFNPRSPCGERPERRENKWPVSYFNPRSPCGERRVSGVHPGDLRGISIHAPRVGSDYEQATKELRTLIFQSTLPVWGATKRNVNGFRNGYFNPRSPCGERRDLSSLDAAAASISIHAPRVGSDCPARRQCQHLPLAISIHAPRVGSDDEEKNAYNWLYKFQSTLPVWGATLRNLKELKGRTNFNPRSPCGERPSWTTTPSWRRYFNPRSPCGERRFLNEVTVDSQEFQSTLPVWGATSCPWRRCWPRPNFNPRSPCGERRKLAVSVAATGIFQSTLPVWGATQAGRERGGHGHISIHAPRVGSDDTGISLPRQPIVFQSTLPVWGATPPSGPGTWCPRFQSTLPVWGATSPDILSPG